MIDLQYSGLLWSRHHCLTNFSILIQKIRHIFDKITSPSLEISMSSTSLIKSSHNGSMTRVREGFDRKIHVVKMADVWGIEKIWVGLYHVCAAHGDFKTRRSNLIKYVPHLLNENGKIL